MSEPFIGEVRMWPLTFAPRGWADCDGQLLPISQNTSLFAILGTTYGGDGRTTMAVPNLMGRAPMHAGRGPGLTDRYLGQMLGVNGVPLTDAQIPRHTHDPVVVSDPKDETVEVADPSGNYLSRDYKGGYKIYSDSTPDTTMADQAISMTGGSLAHENRQPLLAVRFCIATVGLFPPRS